MIPTPKHNPHLQALRHWTPVFLLSSMILFLAWARVGPASELRLTFHDKVDHFFFYGFLATLVFRALSGPPNSLSRWLLTFAIVATFGLLDEVIQHFNPSRQGDPLDWFADCTGALTGIFAYRSATLYRKALEFSPIHWIWQKL